MRAGYFFVIEIYGIFSLAVCAEPRRMPRLWGYFGNQHFLIGLMIFSGLNFTTLKMALIIVFLWCASPVSSHLIARLEVSTNERLKKVL